VQDWLIQYWMGVLFGILTGVMGWAFNRLKRRQKTQATEQAAVKDGILALLHSEIYRGYAECEQKGYATVDDIKNLEFLYLPYHTLGGNSTGTELFERVKKMPAGPPDTA